MQADTVTGELFDDPHIPGTYVTDGARLLRVMVAGDPWRGYVGLEDCASLDVMLVHSEELRFWSLRAVGRYAAAAA